MAISQKMNGRAMSIPGGVLSGSLTALIWTILGAFLLAKLIDTQTLGESAIGYGSMMILLTASVLGSLIGWGRVKRQRAMVCYACGSVYLLMLMAMTGLFFGGQYQAVGVTVLLVAAGCTVALMLSMYTGKPRTRRLRKKNH